MNLHQFRFVREAARRNLNLTETARALFTSQPGVSKAIIELEHELGVEIFERHGKRLRRITEPGQRVLKSVDIILSEIENLKRIGQDYSRQDHGTLSIATTHTQARYVLPPAVAEWRRQWPQVQVVLHQGTPQQVAQMLLEEAADIGLATETLATVPGLISLPFYEWHHVVVVPRGHALARNERLSLAELAAHPLVSYHPSFAGRARVDEAFARGGLKPTIALEAIDSDVIKTYVRLGLGAGVLAEMAVRDDPPDGDLMVRPAGHLFGTNVARVAFKRGAYLREFVLAFAALLSPRLSRDLVGRAMAGDGSHYDL